ncbi:hypothetical protein CCHR01_02194 [Colletotrichum chrysophilum]|uniref:Uncharacterized protein n=1 Tax=Colletotrichum chrysophilum TaxID=1836956 RepID=A0AAD9AWK9_9PEZI|nr:hypothetical protein CCHR01_02194 [Colletotrichum chrysophilum]
MICITQAVELESQLSVEPAFMDEEDREQFTFHETSEKSSQVSKSRQQDSSSSDLFNRSKQSRKTVETDRMDSITCSQRQSKAVADRDRRGNGPETFKSAAESLLQKITSKETLRKLVEVAASRGQLDSLQTGLCDLSSEGDNVYRSVSTISTFVDNCEHGAGYIKICKFYGLFKIAEMLERRRMETARQRVDSADYDRILQCKGLPTNQRTRAELRQQVKLGRQLQKICGPNVGLICLLAVGVSNMKSIANVEATDLEWFHQAVNRYHAICEFGSKCLQSLVSGVDLDHGDILELDTLAQ